MKNLFNCFLYGLNKIIPQTYDDSLSFSELLYHIKSDILKIIEKINLIIDALTQTNKRIDLLGNQETRKKILIIGDSYLAGENLQDPLRENYGALLFSQGFNVKCIHSSGGGFNAVGVNGNFYQIVNQYNDTDIAEFTDILFLGGINDSYTDLTSLENQIIQTVTLARQKFSNAIVHIGYISQTRRADSNILNVYKTLSAYKHGCLTGLYRYINNAEFMVKNYNYISSDGIHPSADGQERIASYLASYLLNGQVSTFEAQTEITFEKDAEIVTGNLSGNIIQSNNIVRLSVLEPTAFVINNKNFTLNGTTSIYLGKLKDGIIWAQSLSSQQFSAIQTTISGVIVFGESELSENIIVPCSFTFRMVQDSIFITPQLLKTAGEYQNCYLRQININPFSVSFSAVDC